MKSKFEVLPAQRDLRFDTLRGLFLVGMTINHLPTEMRFATDQGLGVFSAAEGFVFLSGLLAGWVYTRKYRAGGAPGLLSASLGRAKSIYFWHVGAFVTALVGVHLSERLLGIVSPNVPQLFLEHPLKALGYGLILLHQPGLLDLLPMYCTFVLALPIVISALEAGRRWLVLSVSAALWLAVQWAPTVDPAALYPVNTGSFNLFAWQFLFIAGVVIGHARISGAPQVSRPSPWAMAAAGPVALYGLGIHYFQLPYLWPDHLFGVLVNKPELGLFRLGDFACVAYFVAILGDRFPKALSLRPLEFLGRHSLAVVAAQSVAVMMLLQFSAPFVTETDRTLTAFATIAFLFVVAGVHERLQARRSAVPAAAPIGTRRGAGAALVPSRDAGPAEKPGAGYPEGGPAEGSLSASALHAKPAGRKRRRAQLAPLPGGDRVGRIRERPAH